MSLEFTSLTPEDRAAIVAEVDRTNAIPAGVNTSSPGCVMLIVAVVLFLSVPPMLRKLGVQAMTRGVGIAFLVVEAFLLLLGLVWYFRGSGGAYAKTVMRAESAIETIKSAFAAGHGRECGEAVARLLASSSYSDGPGISSTFKVEQAREQIGAAMPFVIDVEKFLVSEHKVDPVFTLKGSG